MAVRPPALPLIKGQSRIIECRLADRSLSTSTNPTCWNLTAKSLGDPYARLSLVRALGAAPIGNADDHCYPYCTRTVKKEIDHPVWLDGVTLYGCAATLTITHHQTAAPP